MIGPLPPPSATGVRIAGDHYQWMIAWQACITTLREHLNGEPNPVIRLGVEVDGAGNLDDVVLYRRRPPHTYRQVKYAVDSSTPVNAAYLTAPSAKGGPSILSKITASWRTLAQPGDPIELGFITNRAPDPSDPLIAGRDARTGLLLPHGAAGGPGSRHGRARAHWAAAAGLTEPDLLELLALLRFDLARDPIHLQETVALTMLVAGLRADPPAVAAGADWVAKQVRDGHRVLDLDAIRHAVDELQLQTGPARTVVSIATLKPDPLAHAAHHALDWVDRFDGNDAYSKRRPKPPATWSGLQPRSRASPAISAAPPTSSSLEACGKRPPSPSARPCAWSPTPTSPSSTAANFGCRISHTTHQSHQYSRVTTWASDVTSPWPSKSRRRSRKTSSPTCTIAPSGRTASVGRYVQLYIGDVA